MFWVYAVFCLFVLNTVYGQLDVASSRVNDNESILFSFDGWICKNKKCEKASSNNKADSTSMETCNMLCPAKPPLWPKPKYIDIINKNSSVFIKEHIFLKIHSPKEIRSTLVNAANIFLDELPAPSKHYRLIDGEHRILKLTIHVKEPFSIPSSTTNESYTLYSQKIEDELVVNIFANTYFGARHGLETLGQMIWYDNQHDMLRLLHDVNIVDEPSFNHRGVMIDVSRNFFPASLLKKAVDGMAASKLNVLHLHISDVASFPLVLPHNKYLAQNGAYGTEMVYTPEDIKDLVDYARVRGVRTIIEVDAPSHISPKAFSKDQTLCSEYDIFKTTLSPDNPETFNTLQKIYDDLFLLGTDRDSFHIGDDEVILDCWKNTELAKKERNLYNVWIQFTNTMMNRLKVANNGTIPKNILLWSSPLTDKYINSLANQKNIVVQYWFGQFDHILRKGHKIIFSTVGQWYLDCGFGPWNKEQKHGVCDPYTDWRKFYSYRPWKDYPDKMDQVLGGEVCLWSEQVSPDDLETRLWPRAAAFAERVWTDPVAFDKDHVFRRMDYHARRLKQRGFRVAAIWPYICSLYPDRC